VSLLRAPRGALTRASRVARTVGRQVSTEVERARYRRGGRADVAVFHEFAPSPTGGGHQFLRALVAELERRGVVVELNRISRGTPVCLFNSFNFDFRRLRRFVHSRCRMVHRVDGPIAIYRGFDDGTDDRIEEINRELADATVVQSRFSLEAHRGLGIALRSPVVITNTVDPAIFHPPGAREPLDGRKVRLIAVSWSDNPNKGTEVFSWLDRNLDCERYELTFAGRSREHFRRIRAIDAVPSHEVAEELRRSDVYIAASRNDPCSNALLEALACGLPALYLASGGHSELVSDAGLPFETVAELPEALERLVDELEERREAIRVPELSAVADRYLEVLRG
jgi:glycosyltransferase involved in cell wall biosynthesis